MRIVKTPDRATMGNWVAERAAADLKTAIQRHGKARLVIATGASQFEVLDALSKRDDVDWSKVSGFHLDEYIGLSSEHPASFCRYLRERFVSKVPLHEFHYLDGLANPRTTIQDVGAKLIADLIDVSLVGIGENGHLAFNDPPADFETDDPYLIVELDEKCRAQQVGEGWFSSLGEVPKQAISMSIRQIMRSRVIYCSVPDQRKAEAVRNTLEGPVTSDVPASILQQHSAVTIIVDEAAASELSAETRQKLESP